MVLGHALIIFFFMVISELFQVPHHPSKSLVGMENPIEKSILERLSSLTITNGLGTYELAKMGDSWQMLKPRNLLARNDLVEQIIHSLRNLKVRRPYEKDSINLQNFSLHRPTIEMKLAAFGQSQIIKIGLLNSIDDSTYITDDKSSLIYQVDLFKVDLQSLGLSDFIDSSIFKGQVSKVQKLQVKKHRSKKSSIRLALLRKDQLWANATGKGRKLDQDKANELVSKLFAKRAKVILDQRSKTLEERIATIEMRPFFTIAIEQANAQKTTYQVSHPLNSLPGIKLEKKKFVLVTSSQKGHPTLADKSILELLNTRTRQLRIAKK